MQKSVVWDQALLNKYNVNAPRYTSYPTALEFHSDFTEDAFREQVMGADSQYLSLYIHIPFCHQLCYYCGCNKVITRHQTKADEYLDYLEKEISLRGEMLGHKEVMQLHLGGGTPTFLNSQQLARLISALKEKFQFSERAEISIEIDPRRFEVARIGELHRLGFNRISLGVQDINPEVQKAINRIQESQHIANLVLEARKTGIQSVNLDLVYGLPHQTPDAWEETLEFVLALQPDRLSLFSYAHLPSRFAAQRKIKDAWLPSATQKVELFHMALDRFSEDGYVYIGLDHFAKPQDELSQALAQRRLHRNFQGYTVLEECDLLGLGVSSISQLGRSFSQNHKKLTDYYQAVELQEPLERGVLLSDDDLIRQAIIKQIMCNGYLDFNHIGCKFGIDFDSYFIEELKELSKLADDKIIRLDKNKLEVTARGRLLVRNIASVFDAYLKNKSQASFSRAL